LEQLHDLGYLPLEIKALPEGSVVNVGVPVLTITNTEDFAYWLPNYLETWMSTELWKGTTSATISWNYRQLIDSFAEATGGSKEFVMWQGHDFSVRGMSGIEDAAKSGAGHLLSFAGTDNIPALQLINDVYNGKETVVGGSVPASEHSVMCAGGKDTELETYRRLIQDYPSGVLSIVSDTWDFFNVITNTATTLKQEILNRTPDSLGLA
jgi:nicotinamide phosphoribosyltransferase